MEGRRRRRRDLRKRYDETNGGIVLNGLAITPGLVGVGALAAMAAMAAVGVVVFPNAVRSALCLVINFFLLAFIYFTLNAEILGITQVVVYTGAIMVLFLFVIMLLNLSKPQLLEDKKDLKVIGGLGFGLALFALIAATILLPLQTVVQVNSPETYGSPQSVGRALFTQYVWPFEVASVLLLVGIVGSILLAKRKI